MNKNQNKIVCPECNSAFCIDDSHYALISQQVRTKEYNKELEDKLQTELAKSIKISKNDLQSEFKEKINIRDKRILELEGKVELQSVQDQIKFKKDLDQKDKMINKLENKMLMILSNKQELDLEKNISLTIS